MYIFTYICIIDCVQAKTYPISCESGTKSVRLVIPSMCYLNQYLENKVSLLVHMIG